MCQKQSWAGTSENTIIQLREVVVGQKENWADNIFHLHQCPELEETLLEVSLRVTVEEHLGEVDSRVHAGETNHVQYGHPEAIGTVGAVQQHNVRVRSVHHYCVLNEKHKCER